jgi:hypothetical protein
MSLHFRRRPWIRHHHPIPVDPVKGRADAPDHLEPLQDHPWDPWNLRIRPGTSLAAGDRPRWAPATSLCRLGFPRGEPGAGETTTLRRRSCSNRTAQETPYRFGLRHPLTDGLHSTGIQTLAPACSQADWAGPALSCPGPPQIWPDTFF